MPAKLPSYCLVPLWWDRRKGCEQFDDSSAADFGHGLEYGYQCCCSARALQTTRDGCVPGGRGRAVLVTMMREPFEHMLSSFFYHVSPLPSCP